MSSAKQCCPQCHEVCDRVRAIADEFVENAGNQSKGFGMVQAHTTGKSALGEGAGLCDEELVDLWFMMSMWNFEVKKVDRGDCCCTSFGANCMVT